LHRVGSPKRCGANRSNGGMVARGIQV